MAKKPLEWQSISSPLICVFVNFFSFELFFYIALILGKMQGEKLSFWAVKLDPHFHEIMAHRKIMRR